MHIHTDVTAALFAGVSALLLFHILRGLGGYLAGHGSPGAGKILGGMATFN